MSAQVVQATLNLNLSATQNVSGGVVNSYAIPIGFQYPSALGNLLNGTGLANCIDTAYSAALTLSGAATHINLHAFTDPAGNSVAMARCRFYALYNTTAIASPTFLINLYTRTGTDPLTWLPVTTTGALWAPPGGMLLGVDPESETTNGWVVGSGAYDFTVDPGANTCTCNLLLLGNSAA